MVSETEITQALDPDHLHQPEVVEHRGPVTFRPDGMPNKPHIKFDMDELEKLCVMQCTQLEIAAWFDCSESTIEKRRAQEPEFKSVMERGYAKGRISIRRRQIQILDAQGPGAATMAVWLGKNVLGQRDFTDLAVHSPGSASLELNASAREVLTSRITRLAERLGPGSGDSGA